MALRSKADATNEAARLLIAAETRARDAKTARLRELRLARERAEAEAKAEAPAPKKRAAKKAG